MRYTEPEGMAVCRHSSSLYPAHPRYMACLSAHGHILAHMLIILMWSRSSDCIRALGCWCFHGQKPSYWDTVYQLSLPSIHGL